MFWSCYWYCKSHYHILKNMKWTLYGDHRVAYETIVVHICQLKGIPSCSCSCLVQLSGKGGLHRPIRKSSTHRPSISIPTGICLACKICFLNRQQSIFLESLKWPSHPYCLTDNIWQYSNLLLVLSYQCMEFFLSVFWCIVLGENKEEEWAYFMQPIFFELPESS